MSVSLRSEAFRVCELKKSGFPSRVKPPRNAMTLLDLRRFEEAKKVLRKVTPVSQRVLGTEDEQTLSLREDFARAILGGESSAEEKREALQMLEDTVAVMRRVFGPAHPETLRAQRQLEHYRGSH